MRQLPKDFPRDLSPSDVCLIVGKRGTGKSTSAKALAGFLMEAGHAVVAFDPHDEYSQRGRKSEQVYLGPLHDRVTVAELERDPSALDTRGSLAVVPSLHRRECAADFGTFVQLIQDTGDVATIVEEVGLLSELAADELNELATQSRHYAIPLVLVAQRMTQIPKTARTQASVVVSFLQSNPDDLDALADLADGDKELAARVRSLPAGECVVWRDTTKPRKRKGT